MFETLSMYFLIIVLNFCFKVGPFFHVVLFLYKNKKTVMYIAIQVTGCKRHLRNTCLEPGFE